MSVVIDAIVAAANKYGVDPLTALADSYVESGWNPSAVGDNGTSFGLFQLHQGGELDSVLAAGGNPYDPTTNAERALSEFAAVQSKYPGLDPGRLAALAERPANQDAYAQKVDQVRAALASGVLQLPGGAAVPTGTADLKLSDSPGNLPWWAYILGGPAVGVAGPAFSQAQKDAASVLALPIAIASVPTTIGHGIAEGLSNATTDAEVFLKRQVIGLVVAAIVLYVLFSE